MSEPPSNEHVRRAPDKLARYEPSGRVSSTAAVVLPLALATAGACGYGYQRLFDLRIVPVFHCLYPIALAAVLSGLGIVSLRIGRVRNASFAYVFACSLALAALTAAWWVFLQAWTGWPARRGLWITAWALEVLVVVGWTLATVRSWFRRAVFCETEQRFLRRRLLGKAWGCEAVTMRRAAGEGGIEALLDLGLRPVPGNEREGEYRFWLREGASGRWLTIWWHGQLENLRGKSQRRDVLVLRRVAIEPETLTKLQSVLAVPGR